MSPETHAIWSALQSFEFPPGMLGRLSREQRWDGPMTALMVEEYRRFVLLSTLHSVSPSQRVDEVWHLHLLYTEDYWGRLMPLLPAPLHHRPHGAWPGGQGPAGAARPHTDSAGTYEGTLALYGRVFGVEPPVAAWPRPGAPVQTGPVQGEPVAPSLADAATVQQVAASDPGAPLRRLAWPLAGLGGLGVFLITLVGLQGFLDSGVTGVILFFALLSAGAGMAVVWGIVNIRAQNMEDAVREAERAEASRQVALRAEAYRQEQARQSSLQARATAEREQARLQASQARAFVQSGGRVVSGGVVQPAPVQPTPAREADRRSHSSWPSSSDSGLSMLDPLSPLNPLGIFGPLSPLSPLSSSSGDGAQDDSRARSDSSGMAGHGSHSHGSHSHGSDSHGSHSHGSDSGGSHSHGSDSGGSSCSSSSCSSSSCSSSSCSS